MLTRMCYCVCGSTGRAARQHVGQLWRWAPASPRCSSGVFQKWWELEFKTNECIKNEVFGCVVRRHLSNSAQSSFRCYYMHWRRKSFCRFLEILHDLCMHAFYVCLIHNPSNLSGEMNVWWDMFVLCRGLAHGRLQHSGKWTQGDDHTEMVHPTNKQHRWVKMFCPFLVILNSPFWHYIKTKKLVFYFNDSLFQGTLQPWTHYLYFAHNNYSSLQCLIIIIIFLCFFSPLRTALLYRSVPHLPHRREQSSLILFNKLPPQR